jgi:hypothetical protein
MSNATKDAVDAKPSFARACMKAAAGTALGWSVALFLYLKAAPDEDDPLAQYEASKSYVVTMQRMGGSAQMIWNEVVDDVASCFRGQNLGITIFAATTVIAFVYLFRALAREEKSKSAESK